MARILTVLGISMLLAIAGAALTATTAAADAHEGEVEANACPELTQVKYPFITCTANESGGVTLSIPGQPAPLECYMRLTNTTGECAASPEPWWHIFP
jgi:hypothetical protein